ncbi:MAG: hypothetical protein JO157_00160 [Acetobacteraceae bacterium]|nr:hypothetical protein [Acetobacteraceae bacterium]
MTPALLLPSLLGTMLALAACANGASSPGSAGAPAATIAAPVDPNATLLPLDDPSGFQGSQPSTGVGMPSAPNGVGIPSLRDED